MNNSYASHFNFKMLRNLKSLRYEAPLDIRQVVDNPSSKIFDPVKTTVLAKGLNFAIIPHQDPIEDITNGVEQTVYCLHMTELRVKVQCGHL